MKILKKIQLETHEKEIMKDFLDLKITHKECAEKMGCSRVNVFYILGKLFIQCYQDGTMKIDISKL